MFQDSYEFAQIVSFRMNQHNPSLRAIYDTCVSHFEERNHGKEVFLKTGSLAAHVRHSWLISDAGETYKGVLKGLRSLAPTQEKYEQSQSLIRRKADACFQNWFDGVGGREAFERYENARHSKSLTPKEKTIKKISKDNGHVKVPSKFLQSQEMLLAFMAGYKVGKDIQ